MLVNRKKYTDKEAIQKYHQKCTICGEKAKEVKEVKQENEYVRLFDYVGDLVYVFIREVVPTNHALKVGKIA